MSEKQEKESVKFVAYYEALYQAWFATSLEQTKSIFTWASAGAGLTLTFVFSENAKSIDTWVPIWLIFSVVSFSLSAIMCVWVFRINGRIVKAIIKGGDEKSEDGLVSRVDAVCRWLFGVGIMFSILAAICQIIFK